MNLYDVVHLLGLCSWVVAACVCSKVDSWVKDVATHLTGKLAVLVCCHVPLQSALAGEAFMALWAPQNSIAITTAPATLATFGMYPLVPESEESEWERGRVDETRKEVAPVGKRKCILFYWLIIVKIQKHEFSASWPLFKEWKYKEKVILREELGCSKVSSSYSNKNMFSSSCLIVSPLSLSCQYEVGNCVSYFPATTNQF